MSYYRGRYEGAASPPSRPSRFSTYTSSSTLSSSAYSSSSYHPTSPRLSGTPAYNTSDIYPSPSLHRFTNRFTSSSTLTTSPFRASYSVLDSKRTADYNPSSTSWRDRLKLADKTLDLKRETTTSESKQIPPKLERKAGTPELSESSPLIGGQRKRSRDDNPEVSPRLDTSLQEKSDGNLLRCMKDDSDTLQDNKLCQTVKKDQTVAIKGDYNEGGATKEQSAKDAKSVKLTERKTVQHTSKGKEDVPEKEIHVDNVVNDMSQKVNPLRFVSNPLRRSLKTRKSLRRRGSTKMSNAPETKAPTETKTRLETDPLGFLEIRSAAQWKAISQRISWKFDDTETPMPEQVPGRNRISNK